MTLYLLASPCRLVSALGQSLHACTCTIELGTMGGRAVISACAVWEGTDVVSLVEIHIRDGFRMEEYSTLASGRS